MQIARSFVEFRKNVFDALDAVPDPYEAEVRFDNLEPQGSGELALATYGEKRVQRFCNQHRQTSCVQSVFVLWR